MDEGKPIQAKVYPMHKKGHRIPTRTHVTPLKDNEGRVIGVIEYFRDISQAEDLRLLLSKFNKVVKKYVSFASYSEAFAQASTDREAKTEVLDQTILFMDIVSFTTFAETETPSEVVWALNTIFSLCEVPIRECRGDIDKFMGDAVLAVFNNATDAVQAGIRIQKIMGRINEDRLRERKQPLPVRIGINSGKVIRGEVGSLTRKEVMVIGDSVNTAARVQTMAKPGSILVTESAYSRLKNPGDFRDIGELQLKGKNEGVRVFEYCGPANEE
jgi:class 3 adenylate cyclase